MRVQDDFARAQLSALPRAATRCAPPRRAPLRRRRLRPRCAAATGPSTPAATSDREKAVYYVREGEGDEQVLLDPNTLSPDGSISVHGIFPSRDGRLLAYKLSVNNADASTLHLRDLDTGRELPT
jgi:prolyl oligopeptidase